MNELEYSKYFTEALSHHAERKFTLYDGINSSHPIDAALRFASEELGEVATAITRERWMQAEAECIDLAHTAMLVALAIRRRINES